MQVTLQREHAPNGLNTSSFDVTRQTVRKMCEHVRNAQSDPLIQQTAHTIANAQTCSDTLRKLWYWVKAHVKFVTDEQLTWRLFREKDNFELLISPSVLIRMRQPQGDCDCFTMLVCALCQALGIESRIVTLQCDRRRPGEYTHVFPIAFASDKQTWCSMDASHGTLFGWEVPARDQLHRTEWNLNGRIVSDTAGPSDVATAGMGSVASTVSLPVFGSVDFSNPLEWLFFGGAAASLLLLKSGTSKLAGAAGFLGARFIIEQFVPSGVLTGQLPLSTVANEIANPNYGMCPQSMCQCAVATAIDSNGCSYCPQCKTFSLGPAA
jgi:hypothetical protein